MNDEPRRQVTLTKAQRDTPAGRDLIEMLTELSADGQVTREEMERLRKWLEVDRGVDFNACEFLYGVVEPIASDGIITEEELDSLALAIERVLPKDVRVAAALKRKKIRTNRQAARAATRAAQRAAAVESRKRPKPLDRTEFVIRGALRSAERRAGCESLNVGDTVTLDREPENTHDENAILVLAEDGRELGYVPREDARRMARLLDAGAEAEAKVRRLWETPDGGVVPIIASQLRHVDTPAAPVSRRLKSAADPPGSHPASAARGYPLVLVSIVLLVVIWAAYCAR